MSITLGEKLRQAREAHGITISEVADQTRIAALYLDAIENDDYRMLPGGIFNKGFVKSFAKYVGVDEQEAIQDYTRLTAEQGESADDPKPYRPEVLTDERSRSSLLPTIIFAFIIVGLMVWGVLALKSWYENNSNQPVVNPNVNKSVNTNAPANTNITSSNAVPSPPLTGNIKVEFKTVDAPVSLTSIIDGKKAFSTITTDKPATFDLKKPLTLIYAKSRAQYAQLTINGKQINLPSEPADPKRGVIELTITQENAGQIYQNGAITFDAPDVNANSAPRP
ncbi:MAG: helix-turn-helix domain-containing protein [Pyrinomonadaceae bacterium]